MATRMQQRRGTQAQWTSTNNGNGPILAAGEIGFESDNNRFKIGDGVNHWVDLVYFTDAESIMSAVSGLVDGAPELLNTLNELAAALGDNPNFLNDYATQTYVDTAVGNATIDQSTLAGVGIDWNIATEQFDIDSTVATKDFAASLLTNATKSNIVITGDKDGLTITAENGVADSTTDNLTEGSTNKYFTDERAQDAVGNSVGNGLKYTDSSGAIEPDLALSGGLYIDNSNKLAVDGYYVTFNGAEQTLTNKTLTSPKINEAVALTATATELNILDGATLSTTELNYVDGVTSAIQTQIDSKAPTANPTFTGTVSGVTKSMVGLGSVDNTSDADKPVSSATQTALNLKANLAGAAFSGAVSTTDTTQSTSTTTGALKTAGGLGVAKNAYVGGNLDIAGDFTVSGTTTTVNTANLNVTDPMIYMGDGNTSNLLDLGIVSAFNDGTYQHTGLVRDASDGKWKLFKGVTDEPTTTVNFAQGSLDDLSVAGLSASSLTVGSVSNTEIGYLDGVTSAIQTQIDAKLASSTAASTYAPIASPTFTGTVTLPTGTVTSGMIADGTIVNADINASAAIAQSKIANLTTDLAAKAPTASPTFTGTVTTPELNISSSGKITVNGVNSSVDISTQDPGGPGPGMLKVEGDLIVGTLGDGSLTAGSVHTNNLYGDPTDLLVVQSNTFIGDSVTNTKNLTVYGTSNLVGDVTIGLPPMGGAKITVLGMQGSTEIDGFGISGETGTFAGLTATAGLTTSSIFGYQGNAITLKSDIVLGDDSAGGNDVTITKGLKANYSFGTSGQVLSSTGTGVQWITPSQGAAFSEFMLIGA